MNVYMYIHIYYRSHNISLLVFHIKVFSLDLYSNTLSVFSLTISFHLQRGYLLYQSGCFLLPVIERLTQSGSHIKDSYFHT